MSETPNLALPQMSSNSLQPSVPYNLAMQLLDAVAILIMISNVVLDPPVTTAVDVGKRWLVPTSGATGEWAGHPNEIALCSAPGLWVYIVPHEGWRGKVLADNLYYSYDGAAWSMDAGVSATWGTIGGTLSAQTDLQGELDLKLENGDLAGLASATYVDSSVAARQPLGALAGLNDQVGTTYTPTDADAGKEVRCTNTTAIAFNIDTQANVPVRAQFWCLMSQGSTGVATVTPLAGVTLRAPNGAATTAQYDARGVQRISGDEWRVW